MILYTISLHCVLIDQVGSEWELVGVANNSQRGTGERVREKMLKISEIARDNKAEESSHANKRALEERVKEAEAAAREERARARNAENRAELAERAVIEQEQKAQEAERRYKPRLSRCGGSNNDLVISRLRNAEERSQTLVVDLAEDRRRAQDYERR